MAKQRFRKPPTTVRFCLSAHMVHSRLNRKIERQSKNGLLLSILGVVIIVISAIKFGIPFLINLSLFLETDRAQRTAKIIQKQTVFISSPILNPIPYATNSANISISGIAQSNEKVELYINNELKDQTTSQKNGLFIFKNVTLNQGQNTIKARAEKENSQSDFSPIEIIAFANKAPSLSIESPTDKQSFSKDNSPITIRGKTDPGANITINGFWAIVQGNGDFSYQLPLTNGDNQIKVVATDTAGNKTEKDLSVSYSS